MQQDPKAKPPRLMLRGNWYDAVYSGNLDAPGGIPHLSVPIANKNCYNSTTSAHHHSSILTSPLLASNRPPQQQQSSSCLPACQDSSLAAAAFIANTLMLQNSITASGYLASTLLSTPSLVSETKLADFPKDAFSFSMTAPLASGFPSSHTLQQQPLQLQPSFQLLLLSLIHI